MARSSATTCPAFFSQCGSLHDFFSRWLPTLSIHAGSMPATVRANSREVSTSSAAISQRPAFFASGEPGQTWNLMPRAPEYGGSRKSASSTRVPTLPSNPVSSARCTASKAGACARSSGAFGFQPSSAASIASCACTSRHSRTRRADRKS